ncbi:MAG: pyruvate formate-lyase-activating protein [Opitutales bacterium]
MPPIPAGSPPVESPNCAFAGPEGPFRPETLGFIQNIVTDSTADGPGRRFVVSLRGCPLRCQYCHSPEAQGKVGGASKTAQEVFDELLQHKESIHDGGLTLSGGEPLMQPAFVHAMFAMAKASGIHNTLDTSGFVGQKASSELLDLTDLVLLDIKSFSAMTHKLVTGVCVDQTLKFAKRLDERGNKVWIRFVLVPGLTDNPKNIHGLAEFVSQLGNVERVEILPFSKMGEERYLRSGIPYKLGSTPEPTVEQMNNVRGIFARYGVSVHDAG